MNIISCGQYTRSTLESFFKLVEKIERRPKRFSHKLKGKRISLMFHEPSTRTRSSFVCAIEEVGARMISDDTPHWEEPLVDAIRSIQQRRDAIVIRHKSEKAFEDALKVAKIPIISGGVGPGEHPTQGLLDIYTMRKSKGNLDGIKVAVLGDLRYGRTVHSMLTLLSLYENITVYALSKEEFPLPQKYIDLLNKRNVKYIVCDRVNDIPKDVDVLYHTRIQTERFEEDYGKEKFIINKQVLDNFSKETILLHPLPRDIEISKDVDSDPRALFFEQANNGVPIRMALLLQVFGYYL